MFVLLGYVVMCLVFGTTFLTIKIGIEDGMPPFLFAGMRFFIAGALILSVLFCRRQLQRYSFKEYREMAWLGFLMTTIPFAALYWAEQYVPSGLAALLVATAPVFTTIIGIYTGQMRFHWYVVAGLTLGIAGTALIVGVTPNTAEFTGSHAYISKAAIVLAECAFAVGAIRSKKIMGKVSPSAFNGFQMIFASVGLFVLSLIFENTGGVAFSSASLLALFYLAIVASIFASNIYYWLVKETNATFPTTWTYVAPVIAMLVGAIFLQEKISLSTIAGGAGVLFGIILLNWQTWEKVLDRKEKEEVSLQ
jgi:drug/metabolite transporter (DMT)-like permease